MPPRKRKAPPGLASLRELAPIDEDAAATKEELGGTILSRKLAEMDEKGTMAEDLQAMMTLTEYCSFESRCRRAQLK